MIFFFEERQNPITQVALFPGAPSSHQPYWPARHHTLYKLHISHASFSRHDVLVSIFLSDPSPIIGNACHSLTNSLTHCCLVNLIDVTLACEDTYSKLVEVVTVADVSDEDHVDNCLLQIWKRRFGQ